MLARSRCVSSALVKEQNLDYTLCALCDRVQKTGEMGIISRNDY